MHHSHFLFIRFPMRREDPAPKGYMKIRRCKSLAVADMKFDLEQS